MQPCIDGKWVDSKIEAWRFVPECVPTLEDQTSSGTGNNDSTHAHGQAVPVGLAQFKGFDNRQVRADLSLGATVGSSKRVAEAAEGRREVDVSLDDADEAARRLMGLGGGWV